MTTFIKSRFNYEDMKQWEKVLFFFILFILLIHIFSQKSKKNRISLKLIFFLLIFLFIKIFILVTEHLFLDGLQFLV